MKKKVALKKELKKVISKKTLKTKITISTLKKGYQLTKNSFLLDKLNKKELKFPLFYQELKKDFNNFSPGTVIFTPYIIIKKVKLLKTSYISITNIINKLNGILD